MDHNWKILQVMGIPDHLTYSLRILCIGQEVTVRTRHRTRKWFKIRKGVWQGCTLSPCLFNFYTECCAVHSHSIVSDSLKPHGLQHARFPCPSSSPRACSNSCPLTQWCHPTISFSVAHLSSCLQSFPASESFLMSWLFTSCAKVLELQLQSFQ